MSENNMPGIAKYEELGLSNDFMFGKIMQKERYCKPFLEQVLGIEIHHIKYIERQKAIDEKINGRSIRLDIYADDGKTVYNCEMQTSPNRNLPRRSRYYQGQIDINLISKGVDYKELKKSFVIFVCTYDPFGRGQYVYTFLNQCQEVSDLELGDDTVKVFLNTKGTKGSISRDLRELLEYIETSKIPDGCRNPLITELEGELDAARSNKEWRRAYMTLEMLKQDCREEGREKEREKFVINMLKTGMEDAVIANIAELTIAEVQRIKEKYKL